MYVLIKMWKCAFLCRYGFFVIMDSIRLNIVGYNISYECIKLQIFMIKYKNNSASEKCGYVVICLDQLDFYTLADFCDTRRETGTQITRVKIYFNHFYIHTFYSLWSSQAQWVHLQSPRDLCVTYLQTPWSAPAEEKRKKEIKKK